MKPHALFWNGVVGAAEARIVAVAQVAGAGEKAMANATEELRLLGRALAGPPPRRTSPDAEDVAVARGQLRSALVAVADACGVSGAPPDPSVLAALSRRSLVAGRFEEDAAEIALLPGYPLGQAELENALAVAWVAEYLRDQTGLLVSMGPDTVARGTDAEGEPLAAPLVEGELADESAGGGCCVALCVTRHRARTVATRTAHPRVSPATGYPVSVEFPSAAVVAPTALEATFVARLLVAGGRSAVGPIGSRCLATVTDGRGVAVPLDDRPRGVERRARRAPKG